MYHLKRYFLCLILSKGEEMYYEHYSKESFSKETINETLKLGFNPSVEEIMSYVLFLNEKYEINNVKLKITHQENEINKSGGCYIDYKKEIIFFGKINLITVLHELRHYLQFNSAIKPLFKTYQDREEEARGWSSSLFYSMYKEKYLSLAEQGKIKFI